MATLSVDVFKLTCLLCKVEPKRQVSVRHLHAVSQLVSQHRPVQRGRPLGSQLTRFQNAQLMLRSGL